MVGMGNNSDQWIADVVSYIRNSFGNEAPQTAPQTVASLRVQHSERTEPWTQQELEGLVPTLLSREGWKLTASHNQGAVKDAVDGNRKSRYTTGSSQEKGMWFQVELPESAWVSGLVLDYQQSKNDGPDSYTVLVSQDGTNWSKSVASGRAEPKEMDLRFAPVEARFVRVEITDSRTKLYWSIHELNLVGKVTKK